MAAESRTDPVDTLVHLEAWLTTEPDADIDCELNQLARHLTMLDGLGLEDESCQALALAWVGLYERLLDTYERLRSRLVLAGLPLDAQLEGQVTLLLDAFNILARRLAGTAPEGASAEARTLLAGAVHHLDFMAYLLCAMSARSTPAGLWLRAHALAFGLEEGEGLAYRASLALAAVRPESLGGRELVWLEAFLLEHAGILDLVGKVPGREGLMLVDPNQDVPFIVPERGEQPAAEGGLRLISARRLGILAREALGAEGAGLPQGLAGFERDALLERMSAYWLRPPHRQSTRIGASRHDRVEVVVGVQAINHLLSQTGSVEAQHWQVSNRSQNGYALFGVQGLSSALVAGGSLALRAEGESSWQIAVVRWIHSPAAGQAELGLQILAGRASPVNLYFPDSETPGERVPALRLTLLAGEPEADQAMLLARAGASEQGRFLIESPDAPGVLRSGQAMPPSLRTPRIELFRYALADG